LFNKQFFNSAHTLFLLASLTTMPFEVKDSDEVTSEIAAAIAAATVGIPPALLNLPAQVDVLAANQLATNQAIAQLVAAMSDFRDVVALANNRGCSSASHPLIFRCPPGVLNAIPPNFPPTLHALHQMTGPAIAPFLAHYGLPMNGNLQTKKRNLGLFLGIPSEHIPLV
jgi:hypothetical protein